MLRIYPFIAWGIGIVFSAGLNLAHAQPRAWLDRDQITQNESVTLSIENDQPHIEPDYRPLETDFILGTRSRSQQMQLTSRGLSHRSRFDIELIPRRSGLLTIPPLTMGQHKTIALPLNVTDHDLNPSPNAGNPATFGDVFVQTQVDSTRPYVQQNVGIVIRLGHAVPIISGDLILPEPANASLQRFGEDALHKEMINGREYSILERRFILVPEHSGPLALQGAYFKGITGFTRLSGPRQTVSSNNLSLDVQALPNPLPQPWLPLHNLHLRYRLIPDTLKAGQAASLEIEATAIGAQHGQISVLPVPELEGEGQIFAEPVTTTESFSDSGPELKVVQRYAIVAQQSGELVIKGIRMPWWNAEIGQLVHSSLPALTLPVQAAPGGQVNNNPPAVPAPPSINPSNALSETQSQRWLSWLWPSLAVLFALLWLATLIWMFISRNRPVTVNRTAATSLPRSMANRHYHLPDFRHALEQRSVDEVLHMLVAMSGTQNLDAALARLADPKQRQAIEAVQRARWRGEGDLTTVRTRLNHAFRNGPQWKITATSAEDELAPLYPPARTLI